MNPLFISGSEFETPIPMITREGVKPFPPTGYRTLDARSAFFYGVTGITPAMSMRLTGIGSQYLFASLDADKQYFDGAKTYKVTVPKDVPAEKFWSFTLYDNQTRRCSTRRSATLGLVARVIQRPPLNRTPTAQRRSTSVRPSPRGSSGETGYRPIRKRAGSRSCGSTAR